MDKNGNKIYELPEYALPNRDEIWKIIVNKKEGVVVVKLLTGEEGKATCSPLDEFDEVIGYEIAYAKAKIKAAAHDIKFNERFIRQFD